MSKTAPRSIVDAVWPKPVRYWVNIANDTGNGTEKDEEIELCTASHAYVVEVPGSLDFRANSRVPVIPGHVSPGLVAKKHRQVHDVFEWLFSCCLNGASHITWL